VDNATKGRTEPLVGRARCNCQKSARPFAVEVGRPRRELVRAPEAAAPLLEETQRRTDACDRGASRAAVGDRHEVARAGQALTVASWYVNQSGPL